MIIKSKKPKTSAFFFLLVNFSRKLIFSSGVIALIFIYFLFSSNSLYISTRLDIAQTKLLKNIFPPEIFYVSSVPRLKEYIKNGLIGMFTPSDFQRIDISVPFKNEIKLKELKKTITVKSNIFVDGKTDKVIPAKIRIKGDRIIHKYNFENASFKVNLNKKETINGLNKFSLQRPLVRGYSWEYIFQHIGYLEGLMSLRTYPVNLFFNGIDRGIYSIEETPSKITIERNNRKDGPIFRLDETISQGIKSKIDVMQSKRWKGKDLYKSAQEKLRTEFNNAINGKVFTSEVFDFNEWAKFFALVDVFGAYHGALPKSVKFYYNPTLGKFQPILFDNHISTNYFYEHYLGNFEFTDNPKNCIFLCNHSDFYKGFFRNKAFIDQYSKEIRKYSSIDFFEKVKKIYNEKFLKIDQQFYANIVAADGILSKSIVPYFLDINYVKIRQKKIRDMLNQNQNMNSLAIDEKNINSINDFFSIETEREKNINHDMSSDNKLIIKEPAIFTFKKNIEIHDMFFNNKLIIKEPTIFNFKKNIEISGTKKNPLVVEGPAIFIFEGVKAKLENMIFKNLGNFSIKDRSISSGLNFINSNVSLANIRIEEYIGEDAINLVDSDFNIESLFIKNSFSDAVDSDFSSGVIKYLECVNIGNDCLDGSAAKISVGNLHAIEVRDKVISAGEKSKISADLIDSLSSAIVLVSKDGSKLKVKKVFSKNNDLLGSAYTKKSFIEDHSDSSGTSLIIDEVIGTKNLILSEKTPNISVPENVSVEYFDDGLLKKEKMYGYEYGAKTRK